MSWADANTWTTNLSFTDGVHVYSNWRLPATLQPDASCGSQSGDSYSFGYGCTGSEMGHLFYSELGGTALQSILTSSDSDLAMFTNLQSTTYWSGTEFPSTTSAAWTFDFGNGCDGSGGFQRTQRKDRRCGSALAVRSGDIAAVPGPNGIPEPQTLALVGLGFLGLAVARRRG